MAGLPWKRQSLREMVLHPFANLKAIQGLDRLPDRRVTKTPKRMADQADPLRQGAGAASNMYKALGLYSHEDSRVQLYEWYREMDYDAIIARVLDEFAHDACQINPETNRVVAVTARNTQIKTLVERALARGRWEERAPQVTRAMGRDGDVFMHLATARGEGVVATRPYEPWQVARIEDDIGRLIGFCPADDRGCPVREESHSVPYWKVAHFRLPSRNLAEIYGAEASYLWGSRITWRQLQLMLDQVVIQRLLRRPDRLMVLMDTTGMSHDDAYMVCRDWERRLHREWHLDPSSQQFTNVGVPFDGAKDVVLPRGPNNATEITNFPATNTNDLLRDLDMKYRDLANGIGFPHGFLAGEAGNYNPGQSLSRQNHPFAKRASRLQRAFLHELVRVCMIDLAFRGLDVRKEENSFTLHMAPVAPILELEHHEILQMKMDRMDRYLRLGQDYQFNTDVWVPWVLRVHGGLPDDLIGQLVGKKEQQETRGRSRIAKIPTPTELQEALNATFPTAPTDQQVSANLVTEMDGWDERVVPLVEGSGHAQPSKHLVDDKAAETAFEVDDGRARIIKVRRRSALARQAVVAAVAGGTVPQFWED